MRVGCAGVVVEDTFCGPVGSLPPAGQLVSLPSLPVSPGGCAANVALDLTAQGIQAELAGCVGDDAAGAGLIRTLSASGVGCERLTKHSGLPTSKTVILLVEGEDRRYFHSFGANARFSVAALDRDWLESLDVFYLGGLFALPGMELADLAGIFSICRKSGVRTVLDVVIAQGTPPEALHGCRQVLAHTDYFLPNTDEAHVLTGCSDPREQAAALLSYGAGTVIVTLGDLGCLAATGEGYWRCGVPSMPCVDPSGAGDAFASGVIAGLAEEWDMGTRLAYASVIGASATRAVGTTAGIFNRAEAGIFLSQSPPHVQHWTKDSPLPTTA